MSPNPATLVAVAAVLSAAVGASVALFVGERGQPQAGETAQAPNLDRAALDTLVQRQAELERTLETLRTRLEMAPGAESRSAVSGDEIAAAVERWMSANPTLASAGAAAPANEPDTAAAARNRERTLADALARLTDPNTKDSERQRLWKELFEAGLGDQVLAEFESRAEREPNNADARVDLANAYLQKLFTVTSGPEMGLWGAKADKAYDAALAIDTNHWEARFGKAVSLSNWPPFLGKQPEAIKNFELLIEQQSQAPKQPQFAQTHLILGNMYLQMGQKDKALATWQQGASLFPDNEALRKQLELSGG
jgi:tetratricopeptide (TPR) repeat protein